MRYRSRYDKRDSNEALIVKELAKIPGLNVIQGHDDILIGYKGETYWYEIKNPSELNKAGELTHKNRKTEKKQLELADNFTGHYRIVSTLDEILMDLGII